MNYFILIFFIIFQILNAQENHEVDSSKIILEKYVEAIGGKEKIENVKNKSVFLIGNIGDLEVSLTLIIEHPHKLYQEFDYVVDKQITKYDGDKAVVIGQNQIQYLDSLKIDELKYQTNSHLFLDYDKYNIQTKYLGLEKIDHTKVHHIQLKYPNNKVVDHYYDEETSLKLRDISEVTTSQGSFEQILDYDDYRSIDGIKFPFKLTQTLGESTIELYVKEIKINSEIDSSIFEID